MRRAAVAVAALVAAALAGPARAFVRTSDADTGVEVSWPLPVVPYDLSSEPAFTGCAPDPAGDPVEAAVRASFAEWEQSCSELRLVYGGRVPEIRTGLAGTAESLVVIRRGWCSVDPVASLAPCMTDPDVDCGGIYDCYEDHGDRSTVALTTVLYDPRTGRLFDADMEVNGWDGRGTGTPLAPTPSSIAPHGYYFTCDKQPGWAECTTYGQADCYWYDLRNTVTHEAGHFVGLAHPCDGPGAPACTSTLPPWETVPYASRTMYPYATRGETRKRALSPDDVAGVCAIYPVKGGGCGCGSAGGAGVVALLLAALALRPRLRR